MESILNGSATYTGLYFLMNNLARAQELIRWKLQSISTSVIICEYSFIAHFVLAQTIRISQLGSERVAPCGQAVRPTPTSIYCSTIGCCKRELQLSSPMLRPDFLRFKYDV